MVRLFGKKHIVAIILYIFYLILAITLSALFGILNSPTIWISMFFVTLSLGIMFIGLVLSFKAPTPSFFSLIDKPLFTFYFVEIIIAILFLIINVIVKETFLHLLNLIQLPILIIIVAWILTVFTRAKYIVHQVKEEKAVIKMQSATAALIDKSAVANYGYHVSDAIDELTDSIKTMGIDANSDAKQINSLIFENINVLNNLMEANEDETKILSQIKKIKTLIERRREINRNY